MDSNSYTRVDRNELLRKIEVVLSAIDEEKQYTKGEYIKEFLEERPTRTWKFWMWYYTSRKDYKQMQFIKNVTEAELRADSNNEVLKIWTWYSGHSRCAPWERDYIDVKNVKKIKSQISAPCADPTILLSTSHFYDIDNLYNKLKNKGWID